jgi:uncharacterized protein YbaP (TraB family)
VRRTAAIVAGLAGLAVWSTALAQTSQTPLPPIDDSAVVTDLAPVQVNLPGPALWRVTRGDSQVVILGFVRPLPHSLDWPKARILRALDGAHALLVPSEPKLGLLDVMSLMWNQGAFKLPGRKTLKDVLPQADYATYERLSGTANAKRADLDHLKPAVAGLALITDMRKAGGLSSEKPVSTVMRLARQMHVNIREMGKIKAAPLIRIVKGLNEAQHIACFHDLAAMADWEAKDAAPAATAWGKGDIAALRVFRARAVIPACLEDNANIKALIEQGTADAVSTLADALSRPGKTVALIDLEYLDRRNGVLDRLKAKGAQITIPN